MHIDKYKQLDGSYLDEEGITWSDEISFLGCKILGFCGCGVLEKALLFVKKSLELLEFEDRFENYEAWREKVTGHFITESCEYFTWYFLTEKELLEHGGSVPGWLTDLGKEILEDLKELNLEE